MSTTIQFPDAVAQSYFDLIISGIAASFICYFRKKDGTMRRMHFVFNASGYDPSKHNYDTVGRNHLRVWDCEKGGYRCVTLTNIERLSPLIGKDAETKRDEQYLEAMEERYENRDCLMSWY